MTTWTTTGLSRVFGIVFQGAAPPTNFYLALVTAAAVPDEDTVTLSELTEIAAGNGYTSGGVQLSRNSTDFDALTTDAVNKRVSLQIKDVVWTAAGGPLPASGNGARYAVLLDDNATVGSREVWKFWDLQADQVIQDTKQLTVRDSESRLRCGTSA